MTIQQDHKLMEKLGVTELRHLIAHTNKGELTLMVRKGENQYKIVLDAVPIDEELNEELMDLLFPITHDKMDNIMFNNNTFKTKPKKK